MNTFRLVTYAFSIRDLHFPLCSLRAADWFREYGYVPTIEQMKNVYNLPPETADDYVVRKAFLLWYVDRWLPALAGEQSYGRPIRKWKMAVDKVEILGKKRICIESATEAFGWLLLENCHDKWVLVAPKRKDNPKWKIPRPKKNVPETQIYNCCKWSDPTAGQGAGWKPEARVVLVANQDAIKKFRAEDNKQGWKIHKFCLKLLQEHYGVSGTKPPTAGAAKKKRKVVPKEGTFTAEDFPDMDVDSDGGYSEHSEGSAGS